MSKKPERDQNDLSFSRTVLVYSEQFDFIELGYFDFEDDSWYHFGADSFLLKCWCYVPHPDPKHLNDREWPLIKHQGYQNDIVDELHEKIKQRGSKKPSID
ncbi:hypothetical protein DNG35_10655 [Mesonia sp. K7]|nr:hypothetical protein DNG35_10655 [Mesonia sp. K7]